METKRMIVRVAMVAVVTGLAACGSVTGTGGNDVPQGPAVPIAGSAAACTHDGTGVDVTVTPSTDQSVAAQAYVMQNVPDGVDTSVPLCYDYQDQVLTAPAVSLSQMQFTVKDGVVQEPSSGSVKIVSQWFEWAEPTTGTCQAVITAVMNVTDGSMPTCSTVLALGGAVSDPIASYTVQ